MNIINTGLIVDVGVSTTTLTPNLEELCPGQDVVLTCSTTESTMEWLYNGVEIDRSVFAEIFDPVGASISLQASGFMFSAEVISIRPPVFAITLSFSADTAMNGDSVSCRARGQTTTQTIQVVQRGKRSACHDHPYMSSKINQCTAIISKRYLPLDRLFVISWLSHLCSDEVFLYIL